MKKVLLNIFIVLICFSPLKAFGGDFSAINSIVDSSKSTLISVSVKDVTSGKTVFARNDKYLLHPASTLKALTTPIILNELGQNYKFQTKFYVVQNTLYIKLSGDPLLVTSDIDENIKKLKIKKITSIVIDDSAFDKKEWGVGWMWDNFDNPLMPKYSVYNINHNLSSKNIPVQNPKTNFISILKSSIKNNGIAFSGKIYIGKTPQNAILQSLTTHPIMPSITQLLHNSDNFISETLFKIASKDGTTETSIKKFNKFYTDLGLDVSKINIVDSSGVSHNDLIYADWVSEALLRLYNSGKVKNYMCLLPTSGQGTLRNRFLVHRGRIYAKTGTISGVSGIVGYFKGNADKTYSFAIFVQNYIGDSANAKITENRIIEELIKNL